MRPITTALLLAAAAPAAVRAQAHVLTVEQPAARFRRDRLEARLGRIRMDVAVKEAGPRRLAEVFNLFANPVTMFVVKPHDGDRDYASVTLDLHRVTMRNAMSIVQRVSDLRFVYKAGVVMLMHAADVKELTTLRIYDVRAATFRIKDFPGPRIGIEQGEEGETGSEEEVASDNTPSGLTLEKLEEVIRAQVLPDSWGGASGAALTASSGILIVRQTERGHAAIRRLLRQLGIGPRPLVLRRRRGRKLRKAPKAPAARPARRAKRPGR